MNSFAIQLDELVSDAALFAMNSTRTWNEAIEFTENEMRNADGDYTRDLYRLVKQYIIREALTRKID